VEILRVFNVGWFQNKEDWYYGYTIPKYVAKL